MNHLLDVTYNIDTEVQQLQTVLYDSLEDVWADETVSPVEPFSKIDGYGRVYKNLREGKYIPEVYKGNNSYKEVYYNNQSCFFFIVDEEHRSEDEVVFQADCIIAFMLKLTDIKVNTERLDAEVKRDVVSIIRNTNYDIKINKYISGIENVFRGFDTDVLKDSNLDLHPMHVFGIGCTLNYYITDKC